MNQNNGDDPTARRRLDKERQGVRDSEIWAMVKRGYSLAEVGDELGMGKSTVQKSVERTRKALADEKRETEQLRNDAKAMGAPDHLLAQIGDGLAIEDVQTVEDCERLNELESHRAIYLPLDHRVRAVLAQWVPSPAWRAAHPPPESITYPIGDQAGGSWRERTTAAVSGEYRGDPADDEW